MLHIKNMKIIWVKGAQKKLVGDGKNYVCDYSDAMMMMMMKKKIRSLIMMMLVVVVVTITIVMMMTVYDIYGDIFLFRSVCHAAPHLTR